MNLTLTQYIDADPGDVADSIERTLVHGLDAAASRIDAVRDDVVTEQTTTGIRIQRGLDILDGCELRVSGSPRLTTLEFFVPWTPLDSNGTKLLAANTFAHAIATEVRTAA